MKKTVLILNIIIFCFSSHNLFSSNIPAGNVYGHWTLSNSPYLVLGNITVPQDSLLQIDPGVVVKFQGHYQLHVLGKILALGTASNLITFTALTDWWGIRYDNILSSQDSSLFVSCYIEKGNANGIGNYANGGAFFISNFSKIRVQNSTISNNTAYINGGAFYCNNANPNIIGNIISNNTASSYYGSGIYCTAASPLIKNNNMTYHVNSICCKNSSSPIILGNNISQNTINSTIICDYSNPSIINNIISNGVMGIYIDNSSPKVIGNVIINNSGVPYGAGIRCRSSSPLIANNTISNNTASTYGGGLSADLSSFPIIKNNILWGNYAPQGDEVTLDQTSFPIFYNNDIQGGSASFYYYDAPNTFTGTYINNIDLNPLFIKASNNDFNLQLVSPCINSGDTTGAHLLLIDLAGNPRICNNIVEIGAYEICTTVTGIQYFSLNKNIISIYPNPTKDKVILEISENDLQINLTLQLVNIHGIITKQVLIFSTISTIQLDGLSSGVYFYKLKSDKGILNTGKIIIE